MQESTNKNSFRTGYELAGGAWNEPPALRKAIVLLEVRRIRSVSTQGHFSHVRIKRQTNQHPPCPGVVLPVSVPFVQSAKEGCGRGSTLPVQRRLPVFLLGVQLLRQGAVHPFPDRHMRPSSINGTKNGSYSKLVVSPTVRP